jgi:hypothetical protein
LSDDERAELTSLMKRRKTAQALALKARMVLTCAEGACYQVPPSNCWESAALS